MFKGEAMGEYFPLHVMYYKKAEDDDPTHDDVVLAEAVNNSRSHVEIAFTMDGGRYYLRLRAADLWEMHAACQRAPKEKQP